jgi:hypothetical protein
MTSRARSSCRAISESIRPITRRTRSRRKAIILSVMICDQRRSPFDDLASIIGRSGKLSWTSEEIGQTKTVVKSLNSSVRSHQAEAPPTRSERRPARCRRASLPLTPVVGRVDPVVDGVIRWVSRHELGSGESLRGPWDRASPEPNAARVAALMHADARGVQPSAGAGCEANCSGSSLVWWPWQ